MAEIYVSESERLLWIERRRVAMARLREAFVARCGAANAEMTESNGWILYASLRDRRALVSVLTLNRAIYPAVEPDTMIIVCAVSAVCGGSRARKIRKETGIDFHHGSADLADGSHDAATAMIGWLADVLELGSIPSPTRKCRRSG